MSNRRKSHIGVLRNAHDNKDDLNTSAMRKQRRQSIAVHPFISRDTENVVQAQAPKEQPSTPGTTETQKRQSAVPSHRKQRTNLDMTQRYYGDIPNKTPSQISKAISARKKLSNSLLASDISRDDESSVSLFPTQIDPSFSGGSSSSSSSDELNKTTFSDNTEKTASLFVFEATSRLRYSLQGRNNHENDSQDDVGESKVAAVETRPPMMTMTELGKSSHRQSLGSLTRPSAVPGSQMSLLQRRRSLQGQSPDPQTLMGQLSKFKERRLSRQSAGSRRSIGSNVSYRLDEDKDTSMSQGLSNDLLSRFAQNAPESPGKIGAVDVAPKDDGSVASFGSLFEGMSEKETPTDTDFLARTSSVNEVFGELGPHNDNDEDSSTDNFQMTSAGTKLSETNVPASPQESQAARSSSSILGDSPTGSKSISTGQAIGFSSRSSQLGTPAERCSPYKQSPRPLPEAIAFETAFSSQKSDDSVVPSPFKEKTPRSPIDLKRKMSKSPTRMIDSPARNTRSSKRLSKNSAEERRHHQNDENPSTSKSQVAMIDSPARNTRSNKRFSASAEKKRGRDLNFSLDIAESVSKRGRSSGALNSSFRKESSRLFGSARKVAFGSPEVAEFNINSPSVSMTPMPKSANRARSETHNPTVQLENSMAGLLDNLDSHTAVNTSSSTAGSTPFAARRSSDGDIEPLTQDIESNLDEALKQTEDTSNAATEKDPNQDSSNSDMSVELQMEDPTRADESVPHLETNIDDILDSSQDKTVAEKTSYGSDDDASDMSDDSQAANLAGEQTQILEANISELLDGNIEGLPGGFYDGNDEDYTREIEPNMAALLACNASPTQNDKPEQIIFPMEEEITPRAGRASLSSRRLSLEPKSQLSLNVSSDDEEAVERQGLTEVEKEEEPVLDLQINEVLATARASASSPGEVKDIFLKAHIFLQRTNSTVVARMLNDFLECACEENSPFVASKPAELLEDDFLAELSETEKEKLLDLQAHIRSDRREETEKQLGILLEETARSQVFSLENWLVETGHQMEECIAREIDSISLERERVAEEIQLIDDAEQVLSSTKERAVRKARRISLQRRKKTCADYEKEISKLEEDIKSATSNLETAKFRQSRIVRKQAAEIQAEQLKVTGKTSWSEADGMSKKWKTLSSFVPFKLKSLTSEYMSFVYIGACPGASASVSIRMANEQFLDCVAKVDPTVYPKNKSRNVEKYKNVMEFLKSRTQFVCEKLCASNMPSKTNVGDLLRKANWELARVDLTANEICKLQRRYDATLSIRKLPSPQCPVFELEVLFSVNGGKLVASFEITETYPFSPLTVQFDVLEGGINGEEIEANIVKTTKPGFGYLVRTCDVIAASIM